MKLHFFLGDILISYHRNYHADQSTIEKFILNHFTIDIFHLSNDFLI